MKSIDTSEIRNKPVNSFLHLLRQLIESEVFNLFVFLLIVVLFFSALEPSFLRVANAINVIRQISIMAVCAFGMTFAILSGGFDLSVGAVSALAGVIASLIARSMDPTSGTVLGYLGGLWIGIIIGCINGLVITKLNISPLITTLGMMTIVRGIAYIVTGGVSLYGVPSKFQWLGRGFLIPDVLPIPVVVMVLVFIFSLILLYKTTFGRYVYSVGGNEEAARLSGISTHNTKILVYIFVGFTAALSGIILASRLGAGQAASNTGFELDVITAVVLGGVSIAGGEGRLEGTLIGVLIIGVLANGLILMNVEPYYQLVIKGLALLFAVGLDRIRRKKR